MFGLSALAFALANGMYFVLRISTGSFPKPLSEKEESEYLQKFADGDIQARNMLIEHNLRLVAHVIKKYYTSTQDQDDLISIGTIGLIKGINTFRPAKGTRLATYAARCIENEILMHFRSAKRLSAEVSLSDTIDTDKEGNSLALMDIISTDDNLLDKVDNLDSEEKIRWIVNNCLEEREKSIISMRYGMNDGTPMTQREVAAKCGISRSYVSRIEKKALSKLKCEFEKKNNKKTST